MSTKTPDAQLDRTGSHFIRTDRPNSYKEEVYGYFTGTWRNQPVIVTMSADRYEHSSGISEWRIYAQDARYYNPDANGGRGAHLTDTARSRMSDACKPKMAAWLNSPAYTESYAAAARDMIGRALAEAMGGYHGTKNARRLIDEYADRLTMAHVSALNTAADAIDAANAALAAAKEA